MAWSLDGLTESELAAWVERDVRQRPAYAHGYQGRVYLYESGNQRLIVKVATGAAPWRWLRQAMLRHEARVYRELAGFRGAPRCYGLVRGRYLVLEHMDGVPLRRASGLDRAVFFEALFGHIEELHRRGVAHADLKRPDNLMVVDGRLPYLIDFGAAVVRKPGFAPFNHYLYELARRFDFNAWVKLKYQGRIDQASDADRVYYRRTNIEKFARAVKRAWLRVKSILIRR